MPCDQPCSNPQCPAHRIKHFLCNKPECDICSTENGPILCDEMITDTGKVYLITQRERDIAAIVKFFHDNCKDYFIDFSKIDQYAQNITQFPGILLVSVLFYINKDTEGWTMSIHCLSETFPANIAQHFKTTAQDCNIQETYTQFLVEKNIDSFIV